MENAKLLTEAQIKAIEDLAKVVTEIFSRIWEVIKAAAKVVAELWRAIIENYRNKRVVHLALHHKSLRVRKKNRNRIVKWLRRYIKCRE